MIVFSSAVSNRNIAHRPTKSASADLPPGVNARGLTRRQVTPRGLSRIEAAEYIGVSPSLFDQLVKDGRMPRPIAINTRRVWDKFKLDAAFEALDNDDASTEDEWKVAL
jgi:predicted DNA-binding transcriptional regulator AlpA